MNKCPKCDKEIDHLIYWRQVWKTYRYVADGTHTYTDELPVDNADEIYSCPECQHDLFYNEEDAKAFLNQ